MRGMTLTEFLLERINEDEDVAFHGDGGILDLDDAWFSKRRVVAECEAKRRIVESCRTDHEDAIKSGSDTTELASEVLCHLALPYAGHPDYDESWRP